MTTIATDGKSMAGDGLVTSNGTIFGTACRKIAKLKDGRIAGQTGSAYDFEPFCSWLEGGGEPPDLTDSFDALVLHPDGTVKSYDNRCRSLTEELPTACGSGRELAIGAMLAGATPDEAVGIAAQRDMGTGGKILSFTAD